MHPPNTEHGKDDALAAVLQQARQSRQLASKAKADLIEAAPLLTQAIGSGSGQGQRIERLLWSIWNGENKVGLCDDLTCLDSKLAQAAIALLAARAHLGGDADSLLSDIIARSGSKPPHSGKSTS